MKFFLGLILMGVCKIMLHAEETKNGFKALEQFESFYDAMMPAQEKSEKTFAWFSGLPNPLFNAVMHLSCGKNVAAQVDALIARASKGIPLSFWVHPENRAEGLVEVLKERGFSPIITCPLMVWRVKPVAAPKYEIGPAKDIFYRIVFDVFHLENVSMKEYASLLKKGGAENHLVYIDSLPITKPVGTGTILPKGKVGGIFNIATITEYQKRGCAHSMMLYLMNRAHQLGLDHLILLSSPVAEKMYLELGFEKVFDIEIYAR